MPLEGLPGPGPWELWRGGGKVNAQLLTGIFTNPSPFFQFSPRFFYLPTALRMTTTLAITWVVTSKGQIISEQNCGVLKSLQ